VCKKHSDSFDNQSLSLEMILSVMLMLTHNQSLSRIFDYPLGLIHTRHFGTQELEEIVSAKKRGRPKNKEKELKQLSMQ